MWGMHRAWQTLLIVFTLADCWLAMQAVHEFGHVVGAWATVGVVAKVVLRPWTFSRTELATNPDPLVVAWAGPVLGAVLPVAAWLVAALSRLPGAYLVRFVAGFCLVANGAYLGGGALDRLGDAGDLQRHGSPLWMPLAFAAVTVPAGLALWHGQGRHFGFAGAGGRVSRRATVVSGIMLVAIVALELTFALE